MTSALAAVGAVVTGAILALFTIVGGVSAVTPAANGPEKSETVVVYDAP
ncbi:MULTISPECIES: hypothetical protein [unclassified Janibacter]